MLQSLKGPRRILLLIAFIYCVLFLFSQTLLDVFQQWKYGGEYSIEKLINKDWILERFLKPVSIPKLTQEDFFLLVTVSSAPENSKRRDSIRKTWGNSTLWNKQNHLNFKVVFVLGQSIFDEEIEAEQEQYNDLVVGSFHDTYRNLLYKTLFGLSWASQAVRFKFLFKTDDDVYLNVACLMRRIEQEQYRFPRGLYAGDILRGIKPDRRASSKWKIDKHDYPSDYLPPFASGAGILLSFTSVKALLKSAELLKPIHNEDVYIGLLAHYSGLKPYDLSDLFRYGSPQEFIDYSKCQLSKFCLFLHGLTPEDMTQLHYRIVELEKVDFTWSGLCLKINSYNVCLLGSLLTLLCIVYVYHRRNRHHMQLQNSSHL